MLLLRQGVGGIVVSIAAFQAVDPGSIPGRRNSSYSCLIEGTTVKTESCRRCWAFFILSIFEIFFSPFLFLLFFSFCCSDWPSTGLACTVKKLLRKRHRDSGKFLPWSSSEFLTQLFEHFCAYLRLHKADHSDLGIIGKIFSSCRSSEYR